MGVSHIRITANGEHVGTYATTTPGEVLLLRELVRTINLDSNVALSYEVGHSDLDGLEQIVARLPEYHSESMHRAHMLDQALEPLRTQAESVLRRIKEDGSVPEPSDDDLHELFGVIQQLRRLEKAGSREAARLSHDLQVELHMLDDQPREIPS